MSLKKAREKDLNLLEVEEDLSTLQLLVELRKKYILQGKDKKSDFQLLIYKNQIEDFKTLKAVLKTALEIQETNEQLIQLLEFVHANLPEGNINILKLFLFSMNYCKDNQLRFENFTKKLNFNKAILSLIESNSEIAIRFFCSRIAPVYFQLCEKESNEILETIWMISKKRKNFDLICILIDFYSTKFHLIERKEFWEIFQQFLHPGEHLKQILYLLQKILDNFKDRDVVNLCEIIKWDLNKKVEILHAWQNFLTIFEILREKQLHLVEPIFLLLPTIHILPSFCLTSIYQNLLQHTHTSIVNSTLISIVQSRLTDQTVKLLIPSILSALNGEISASTWREFANFTQQLPEDIFFLFLEESLMIKWSPANSYCFYQILQTNPSLPTSPDQIKLIEDLTNSLNNIPHSYIREGCKKLLKTYIFQKDIEEYATFRDYVRVVCPLLSVLDEEICLKVRKYQLEIDVFHLNVNELEFVIKLLQFDYFIDKELINLQISTLIHFTCVACYLFEINKCDLVWTFLIDKLKTLKNKTEFSQVKNLTTFILNNAKDSYGNPVELYELCKTIIEKQTEFNNFQVEIAYFLFFSRFDYRLNQLDNQYFEGFWETEIDYFPASFFRNLNNCPNYLTNVNKTINKLKSIKGYNYNQSINALISNLLENPSTEIIPILNELFDAIQDNEDCVAHLALTLSEFVEKTPDFPPFTSAIRILLIGETLGKTKRMEYEVCSSISQKLDKMNPFTRRVLTRFNILKYLKRCGENPQKANDLAIELINTYRLNMGKRYYQNSQILLEKLRVMQGLAVIHNQLNESIIDFLLDCICNESHQSCIKFFIQILLIKLLRKLNWLKLIGNRMESTNKSKPSTIIAFIPILYHLTLMENNELIFNSTLELMIPWMMGPHFNLRLYAQEGVRQLLGKASESIRGKYALILHSTQSVLKQSREIDQIDQYFLSFDPEHFDLKAICYLIPMITQVPKDEYECLESYFNCNYQQLVQNDSPASAQQHVCSTLIQKKITPPTDYFDSIERKTKLIIIASLVEKSPNLGGLSRTCEIFRVQTLVINSLNSMKSIDFKGVSMSSENWVDIKEVKKHDLPNYLDELNEDGYKVIGLEQTIESVSLIGYQFPEKCALILGNEKEGIPPNILPLVSECIVIPQFGVIRSLNVHVAGAVCIWEYVKQHIK